MPNWLGDAVMASPIIYLIKRKWPQTKLTLFGKSSIIALFENDPYVDDFLPIEKKDSTLQLIYKLREKKFDFSLLLTHSFSSAWLFFRAHISERVGFSKDMRRWLLTNSIPYPKNKILTHHVWTYQNLLEQIGIQEKKEPLLYVSEKEEEWANNFIQEREIKPDNLIIGVNPSAAFGSSKCWLEERFREVSESLVENEKAHLFFFGDAHAYEKNNRISFGLKNTYNLAGKTSIRQLMSLIKKCDLFLTNDSGPMHIACALKRPVVAIFGSTSPDATGPYQKGIYLYEKADCSPCFKRECPIDFRCMKAISSELVYQSIKDQLKRHSCKICIKN